MTTTFQVVPVKARLIRIGNSRGIRLPKSLIEEAGLTEELEVEVKNGAVVVRAAHKPRVGWAESARLMKARGEDGLLEEFPPTRWMEEEWKW